MLKTVLQLSAPWVEEKRIKVTETSVNDELNKAITIEETKRAIYNIKKDSAPGPDKIEYKMVKELPESCHEIIRDMFNNMFINTFIPEDWAKYQVVFIDKPGKEKVRPISLSSCFGKIFERIITEKINWWAEKNNKIEKSQNGFRKGKSCLENIVQITVDTQVGMHENTSTLAAFLDVSAAYDNVQYSILINKLIKEGCPYRLCKYVENWMYSRKVEFVIDKEEITERRVYKGLPQGAVLSPILYDFYTNKVVEDIPQEVRSVQFADDIAIYCKNKSSNNRKAYLETAFQKIHENLEKIGLELQPEKTALIEFNKKGHNHNINGINIQGVNIATSNEVKFLGIWLDKKLSFEKQCKATEEKVIKANGMLKYMN